MAQTKRSLIESINPSSRITAIEPVRAITAVQPVQKVQTSDQTSDQTLAQTATKTVPPDVYVDLSSVKAVQPYPYGNIRRGGFMIGDESTLLRASWGLLGYASQIGSPQSSKSKLQLIANIETLMQLPSKIKHAMEQSFIQGRAGEIKPQILSAKIVSWVGSESALLDLIAELMVYITLAGDKLSQKHLQHLIQGVQPLQVSSTRLQHLIELRQRELALGTYFKQPQGGFIAFTLPKPQEAIAKHKAVLSYAQAILGLESSYNAENVACITQALVLHYAPVRLSSQHVPRPMIRLCNKKLAEAIAAYNLLRSL